MTLADAAGMAAFIAEALEPIPLAATRVDMSFHEGYDEAYIVETDVIDFGSTLATSRIRVFPASDLGESDPRIAASGEATARLFERAMSRSLRSAIDRSADELGEEIGAGLPFHGVPLLQRLATLLSETRRHLGRTTETGNSP